MADNLAENVNGCPLNRGCVTSDTPRQQSKIIGVSLSEPHINVLNASGVCMYVCMYICMYVYMYVVL